jgi:hypothetical protein
MLLSTERRLDPIVYVISAVQRCDGDVCAAVQTALNSQPILPT